MDRHEKFYIEFYMATGVPFPPESVRILSEHFRGDVDRAAVRYRIHELNTTLRTPEEVTNILIQDP